jgi:hypothetical protein
VNASFPSPTITPLYAFPLPYPLGTCRFLCEAWWTCKSTAQHTWRNRSDCVLTTGQLLSVILPQIRHDLDLVVEPEPQWTGAVPDWEGIPCRIGRVQLWLPVQGNLPLRPFSLLALFPKRMARHALPYVYLGIQFCLEYRARVVLDGSSGLADTSMGQLIIP